MANTPSGDGREALWKRTETVQTRLERSIFYAPPNPERGAPYGYWKRRPIIGRDMENIIGSVSVGGGRREAVVVDEPEGGLLKPLYDKFFVEMEQRLSRLPLQSEDPAIFLLREVFKIVQKILPYDEAGVKRVIDRHCKPGETDVKIRLDSFLNERAGVCRHQALLAAYFIQKLKHERRLKKWNLQGSFSVDRNEVVSPYKNLSEGAHVWVRYTPLGGKPLILDVTQQKQVVSLESLIGDRRAWIYARPEELQAFRAAQARIKKK